MGIGLGLGGIVLLFAIVVISSFRVLREYERGVIFRLGKLLGLKIVTKRQGSKGKER